MQVVDGAVEVGVVIGIVRVPPLGASQVVACVGSHLCQHVWFVLVGCAAGILDSVDVDGGGLAGCVERYGELVFAVCAEGGGGVDHRGGASVVLDAGRQRIGAEEEAVARR